MNCIVSRQLIISMLLVGGAMSGMSFPEHAWAQGKSAGIESPADARRLGLESLHRATRRDGVPLPPDLDNFIKDRRAALQLGKALFWDMQVGSDGVQACASCHFHAGADDRSTNALNPALRIIFDTHDGDVEGYFNAEFANFAFRFESRQPNDSLRREDFPFVKTIQETKRSADGIIEPEGNNVNDIVGSMGVFFTQFEGIRPGVAVDAGTPQFDPVFNVHGRASVRRVEPRNTPSVINAVFNFTNFWDGRASPIFNGRGAFGHHDRDAEILVNQPGKGLIKKRIAIENASLASQSMQPPSSPQEMSFDLSAEGNLRTMSEIGMKLLRRSPTTGAALVPLGLQKVHRRDSVLGELSRGEAPGLAISYEALIKKAFADEYWNSKEFIGSAGASGGSGFTQMEANFSLFFGLAVMLYQSTLVADQTPFDKWMETGRLNGDFDQTALAGLNLFVNQGRCIRCHSGPELTAASVRNARGGNNMIRAMTMANGAALYDNGFYNTSITPSTDDAGRGDLNINDQPLASARQALFDRLGIDKIEFPIIGNDSIPAVDEDHGSPVCEDSNANGLCDPGETILPAFRRVAVDGAFKTPGLRNSELTGPYFHNGGMATLRQVVQFYNRGGNFCRFNLRDLDTNIEPLGLTPDQEEQLVAFLVSLTDRRVKYRQAPFDHPELKIPADGLDTHGTRIIKATGARGSEHPLKTFLELDPLDAIFTPAGTCSKDSS